MAQRVPHITLEAAAYFSKMFPDRAPSPTDSEREIWMAVGAAKVAKKLRQVAAEQAGTTPQDTSTLGYLDSDE